MSQSNAVSGESDSTFEPDGPSVGETYTEEESLERYQEWLILEEELPLVQPTITHLKLTGKSSALDSRSKSEFVKDLLSSHSEVNDALNFLFSGDLECRFSVIGEESDVPVWNLMIYTSSPVSEFDYHSIINRHHDHCPITDDSERDYESMIDIRDVGEKSGPFTHQERLVPETEVDCAGEEESIGSYVASLTLHDSEYRKYWWSPTAIDVIEDAQSEGGGDRIKVNATATHPWSLNDPRLFAERLK